MGIPEIGPRTQYRKYIVRMPPTSASSGSQPHRRQFSFWSAICLAVLVAISNSATPDPAPRPAPPHGNNISIYFVEFTPPAAVPQSLLNFSANLSEISTNLFVGNNSELRSKPAPQEPVIFNATFETISNSILSREFIFHENLTRSESTLFVGSTSERMSKTAPQEPLAPYITLENFPKFNLPCAHISGENLPRSESTVNGSKSTAQTTCIAPQEPFRCKVTNKNNCNTVGPRHEGFPSKLPIDHGAGTKIEGQLASPVTDTTSPFWWYVNNLNSSPLTVWPTALPPTNWIMPSLTESHAEGFWIMPSLTDIHSGEVWNMPSLTALPADASWIMPSLTALVSNAAAATRSGHANQADTIVPRRTEAGPETMSTSPIQGGTSAPPRGLSHPSKGSDGMAFWSPPPPG